MAGKGGKGLLAAKTTAAKTAEKDKGKKAPISRSSRAGLQLDQAEGALQALAADTGGFLEVLLSLIAPPLPTSICGPLGPR
jgi:hypothetical protein